MTVKRLLLVGALLVGLAGAAYLAKELATPADQMADSANKLLASLKPAQKKKASFSYDSEERTNWHFIPMQDKKRNPTRKGLGLFEMDPEQRKLTLALLKAGTSAEGYVKATTIMTLEGILDELEKNPRGNVRSPKWYFVSIFGPPSKTGKWGWRIEGHHLSLNFVIDGGKVVSSTPAFFGANPAVIKTGKRKGFRTLPQAEDLPRELLASLDKDQIPVVVQDKLFAEVEQGKSKPNVGKPVGLPASKMTKKQKDILIKLVESYANRMPPAIAKRQLAEVITAGVEKIHFAYAEDKTKGKKGSRPYTYRVQGPTFVIEFLNTQPDPLGNPANHIHSVWRNLPRDFGLAAR